MRRAGAGGRRARHSRAARRSEGRAARAATGERGRVSRHHWCLRAQQTPSQRPAQVVPRANETGGRRRPPGAHRGGARAARRGPPRANGAESRGTTGVYGRSRRPARGLARWCLEQTRRAGAGGRRARATRGAHGAACDTHGRAMRGADEDTE